MKVDRDILPNGEDEENERNGVRVAGTEGATESCYLYI